jgi:hypothetical protein
MLVLVEGSAESVPSADFQAFDVGASLAGLRAVEAARKTGFDGRITAGRCSDFGSVRSSMTAASGSVCLPGCCRGSGTDCQSVVAQCAVMNIDRFWDVIESVRSAAAEAGEPFDEGLVKQLANGPQQEILEYAERFDELHDALYRWDMWAAAYLIGAAAPMTVSLTSAPV